jgi:UDP-N-acetyl-D-galactosamine dehydrogenase
MQQPGKERVAVIGLGYVGLPVALAFARQYPETVGFDIDTDKIRELRDGHDRTGEVSTDDLRQTRLLITSDPADLVESTCYVVAVPTPIDESRRPDLRALEGASRTVGAALRPGDVVVYESTVYPGLTEEFCGPILEEVSGLTRSADFTLGYSPERINPGDKEHSFETILKVVAGEDEATLERVAALYDAVVKPGTYRATSIKVAEAAKVIENTQRDLNIALMNEIALICDRLDIRTLDVLEAAGTKWNFLPFRPGLVGGHCIGVDPYYLTAKAKELGYLPEVILAGRRINDSMGAFVARRTVKMLGHADVHVPKARVGILGLTFKEDCPDLRNSRIPDIVEELREFGVQPMVHDPLAEPREAESEYGIVLEPRAALMDLDALIIAVRHRAFLEGGTDGLLASLRPGGLIIDVKSVMDPQAVPPAMTYWSL